VIENIALSGIEAGLTRLSVAANNIANASTPGFERQSVIQSAQPDGGTQTRVASAGDGGSLLHDQVNQLTASYAIQASVLSLKVAHDTLGTLLDQRA
jgi:flagellar basal-body rod protein FlgC